ncbi:hypothetical protein [Blautia obeum]|nr:hypothetical protein [Blautia obeum]
MAESIKTTVVENLPENAAPGDTDYIITAQKNILKKTKIAQLVNVFKEKLGINTLNTKINNKNVTLKTYNVGGYLQTGQTYCIYNDSFLYLHIGFNSIDNSGIQSGTVIMTLPVKVSTVNANIGVIGMGTVQGYKAYIGALSVSSNGYDIVASGFIIAANYIADLMFIRA